MSALLKLKQEALAQRLAGLALPEGGASWLAAARADAGARLQASGLPVKRDEYWRYTDPSSLTSAAVLETPVAAEALGAFEGLSRVKLVFVDGVYDAQASDLPALSNVTVTRLADATDASFAAALYGQLETAGQSPVARPLAALNTATATEGVLIHATGAASHVVSIEYRQVSTTSDVTLHHVVKLEEGAELTLTEAGEAGARFNGVMEVEVANGASFNHIRTQGRDHKARALTHIFARLGSEAAFKSFTMMSNGGLTRNEAVIWLNGDDSSAHVAGATLGDAGFHHDDTIFITHAAERCESRQVFKKVLRNGATGVFQGKILVKQGAQKTDGYQISQSLLLDGDSNFLVKPELEIYADDVKCSHGSTSGAIDETALYYLRSRGVPKRVAEGLLVQAFLAEVVDEIADEEIADRVREQLAVWLEGLQAL